MYIRPFFLLFVFLFAITLATAATGVKSAIGGVVVEYGTDTPIEAAAVRLLQARDSTFITGVVTAPNGSFKLSGIKPGNYLLEVSFIGYKTQYRTVSATASPPANLRFRLREDEILLSEAVVIGKAPEVVVKSDTVEYNADSYKTQPNAVIEDLIKKLPGVEVDADGKITAKGKQVTKILIDGKEFFGDDPSVASKNLPVNIVDKLQVVERKSEAARLTGVDDGEEETVINLTVKKGMKKGWFGNAQAGYGTQNRYEVNALINNFTGENQFTIIATANNTNNMGFTDQGASMYGSGTRRRSSSSNGVITTNSLGGNFNIGKDDNFRLGGDVMYSNSNAYTEKESSRQNFLGENNTSYLDEKVTNTTNSENLNINLRLKWNIDTLNTLEVVPYFSFNRSRVEESSTSSTRNNAQALVNSGSALDSERGMGYTFSGRVGYSHRFANTRGRRFSVNLDYRINGSANQGESNTTNQFYLPEGDSISNIHQELNNRIAGGSYRAYVTYVEPIFSSSFLNFSYRFRYNYNTSDLRAYDLNNGAKLDSLYSNNFTNDFTNSTYSVGLNTVRPKYNYNVAIDVNPYTSKSINNTDERRNVPLRQGVNLSPSLFFIYNFDKKTNLRIDYRGRTQQPSINQLQEVKNITNPLYISTGNPNLTPSYINFFSIRYTTYKAETQASLNAGIRGSYTLNSIVNQTEYDPATGVQTTRPVNTNGVWNATGMVLYSAPLRNRKFQINNFTHVGVTRNKGFNGNKGNLIENTSTNTSLRENFNITYRSDVIDLGLRATGAYSFTHNTLQQTYQQTVSYGGTFNTTVYLPFDISLSSDITYTGNAGYAQSYNREEWMWNAQAAYQFLKGKQATISFKIYDILQQRTNISRTVTGNYIQDVSYNTINSYCMLYFTYRFNTMGGAPPVTRNQQEMQNRPHR